MTKDEVAAAVNEELGRHGVERTHENAQKVLSSLIDHLEQFPARELTRELIAIHADMVLVPGLTAQFTN